MTPIYYTLRANQIVIVSRRSWKPTPIPPPGRKPSEILWAAHDRIKGRWCKKALRKKSGGVCITGGVNQVTTGNVGHYSGEYEPMVVFRKLDSLAKEHRFHDIEGFNDAPTTRKQDALDLVAKAAIYFEERGQ
jgi:hypothetical protein